MKLLSRYRATGADLPFGNPARAHHGVSMEGYFWRITDPATGRVVIALCGANEGPRGRWATVGVAAWPAGFVRAEALDGSWTNPDSLSVRGGLTSFDGDHRHLRVNIGEDAQLDFTFDRYWSSHY